MKKIIGFLCILVIAVIFCLAAIRFAGQAKYQDVIETGKIVDYENADAVIDDSVLIARVKKTGEVPSSRFYDLGLPLENTLSAVEVEEVFQNAGDALVSTGSEIHVLESQWTDEESRTVHHLNGYVKMETGKQYLLLLGYNPSVDNYYPLGLLYGKIPMDLNEDLFLGQGYDQVKETIDVLREKFCPKMEDSTK